MEKSSKVFVGMDVHKESIDVTLAEEGGELRRLGQIGGDRASLLKMVRRQQSKGRELVFVYEAGPCGFWIYREIVALGACCMVVSPKRKLTREEEIELMNRYADEHREELLETLSYQID